MNGYMNVEIRLQNSDHADALARRLVQMTDRIRITVFSEERVDYARRGNGELMPKEDKDNLLIVDDALAAACSSASQLLALLKERYKAKTGRRLCCAADGGPVIIGVGSAAGGSGTTAAAVTLARILAGKLKGETALIFADGSGNPMIYIEKTDKDSLGADNRRTARELDYMLTHNIETEVSRYITGDRYGPLAAVSAAEPRLLLDRLEGLYNLEAAVLDLGSGGRTADCHIYIEVAACGDLRAAAFEKKAAAGEAAGNRILLLNKTAAINSKGRLFCLPNDPESFQYKEDPEGKGGAPDKNGEIIEISMDGLYAAAMRQAAEEVVKIIESCR